MHTGDLSPAVRQLPDPQVRFPPCEKQITRQISQEMSGSEETGRYTLGPFNPADPDLPICSYG